MKRHGSVVAAAACLAWSSVAHAQEATCIATHAQGLDGAETEAAVKGICSELLFDRPPSIYRLGLTRSDDGLDVVVWSLGQDGVVREHRAHVEPPSATASAGRNLADAMAEDPAPVSALPCEPSPPPRPRAVPTASSWSLRAAATGGAIYQSIYAIPITGWEAAASLGAESPGFGVYGFGGGGRGTTQFGRRAASAMGGIAIEGIVGRLRIGSDLEIALLSLESVDAERDKGGSGPGLHAFASFDVVTFGRHAVFLLARGGAYLVGSEGGVLDASLEAGARF
jgi:hypothetical protein